MGSELTDWMEKVLEKHGFGSSGSEADGSEDACFVPDPVRISYSVPILAQPTNMSCWATAIAMMIGWKDSMSIAPETIADELGYTQQFNGSGLHPEDTKIFRHWGLSWEAPMCYTVSGFADLLDAHGPVWLAGNPSAPHVRVITGISGDGTPDGTTVSVNDPAGGRQYKRSYTQVAGTTEALGTSEARLKSPIYVAHF